MRRATIYEFDMLADKLSKYVGQMKFRLMDLCVKAEPAALLNVKVFIEGRFLSLEDCAKVAKSDDYNFMIIPNYEEDLLSIQKGIFHVHPEFKIAVETMQVEVADENGNLQDNDVKYLLVTMPEVNDDRYDVLKDGVKIVYEDCKANMENANAKAQIKFAELYLGESPEDVEKVKLGLDKLREQWNTQRDKVYNEKIQEIEDAYNMWLNENAERELKRQEDEAAHGTTAATSMRLDENDVN